MNHFFKLLIIFIFVFPTDAFSEITFDANGKWETSFDYPEECSIRGVDNQTNCGNVQNDGTNWNWGGGTIRDGNTYTQAVADANYPGGGGGLGARFWNYDGHNTQSGPIRVSFPNPQKELWIRWYMRYQEGFQWRSSEGGTLHRIHYNKTLYLRTGASGADVIPGLWDYFQFRAQGDPKGNWSYPGGGWNDSFGPGHSDGQWHCFEVYIKMNSSLGSSDGLMRWWVNGVLYAEQTDIRYDNNNATSHEGFTYFTFNNNQNYVSNADGPIGLTYAYIDYDDMVIYNQTPPNSDEHGNHFIGPISSMAPPRGLIINVQ